MSTYPDQALARAVRAAAKDLPAAHKDRIHRGTFTSAASAGLLEQLAAAGHRLDVLSRCRGLFQTLWAKLREPADTTHIAQELPAAVATLLAATTTTLGRFEAAVQVAELALRVGYPTQLQEEERGLGTLDADLQGAGYAQALALYKELLADPRLEQGEAAKYLGMADHLNAAGLRAMAQRVRGELDGRGAYQVVGMAEMVDLPN